MRTHDGLNLFVRVDGPDDAPLTVILAHGWVEDHDFWRYQVRDLRAAHGHDLRIVSYDHRGHGASDETPHDDATIVNLGRDLSAIIDTYAPKGDLVMAGHSMGGMTIMELSATRPELFAERVAGVMFVSTSAGRLDTVTLGLPKTGQRVKHQIPKILALRSRTLSHGRRRRAPVIETIIARRFLFGEPMRLRDQMLIVESLIHCPATTMSGFFADMMEHERHSNMGVLAGIPTSVLVGERDLLTPVAHSRRLAAAVPGSRLILAPGAGHMLPLERDDLVSTELLKLIEPALAKHAAAPLLTMVPQEASASRVSEPASAR